MALHKSAVEEGFVRLQKELLAAHGFNANEISNLTAKYDFINQLSLQLATQKKSNMAQVDHRTVASLEALRESGRSSSNEQGLYFEGAVYAYTNTLLQEKFSLSADIEKISLIDVIPTRAPNEATYKPGQRAIIWKTAERARTTSAALPSPGNLDAQMVSKLNADAERASISIVNSIIKIVQAELVKLGKDKKSSTNNLITIEWQRAGGSGPGGDLAIRIKSGSRELFSASIELKAYYAPGTSVTYFSAIDGVLFTRAGTATPIADFQKAAFWAIGEFDRRYPPLASGSEEWESKVNSEDQFANFLAYYAYNFFKSNAADFFREITEKGGHRGSQYQQNWLIRTSSRTDENNSRFLYTINQTAVNDLLAVAQTSGIGARYLPGRLQFYATVGGKQETLASVTANMDEVKRGLTETIPVHTHTELQAAYFRYGQSRAVF